MAKQTQVNQWNWDLSVKNFIIALDKVFGLKDTPTYDYLKAVVKSMESLALFIDCFDGDINPEAFEETTQRFHAVRMVN